MIPFFGHRNKEPLSFLLSSVEEKDKLRIIRPKGDISMLMIPGVIKSINKLQKSPGFEYKNTLVDFKGITHFDTAAVAELINVAANLKKSHHRLGIINLNETFRSELQILKVDHLIVEYSAESDAIKDLTS